MFRFRGFAALFLAAGCLLAQAPQFEVASVKPAQPFNPSDAINGKIRIGVRIDAGRVDMSFISLFDLIRSAYEVKAFQISGPDWLNSTRFDIVAKIPDGVPKERVPAMLKSLLAERFKLATHTEKREHSIYALVAGKNGIKMKPAEADANAAPADDPGGVHFTAGAGGRGGTVTAPGVGSMRMMMGSDGNLHMEASAISMVAFVEMLTRLVDRPVVDETGLKGNYQVTLDLAPSDLMHLAQSAGAIAMPGAGRMGVAPANGDASDPGGTIFTAVQNLGLKLEPRRESVDTVIVDHVEKTPIEN
ncbi:MAG TPA: TIGR03435 family protein [Bryobacteraceae bacterium]|nr:TIGR03435 family protein [Bryobacteraceae bacterium]